MKIEESLWIEFLYKMNTKEYLFVKPSSLGTMELLDEIEKFVIANMPKESAEN